MLKLSKSITDVPVVSLRTGGKIAQAGKAIINPNNLKIEGWHCTDVFSKESVILLAQDLREIVPQGFAVNDFDVLSTAEELVRLHEILEIDFELIGKAVVSDRKRKLGKVNDYAIDPDSMAIQKLYVARPMYRSISDGQLSIDRSQIVEINERRIVVREADVKVGAPHPATAPAAP